MREIPASVSLLLDIEARQDEVLRQIAELDARLDRVLAECSAFCRPAERQTLPTETLPLQSMPPETLPLAPALAQSAAVALSLATPSPAAPSFPAVEAA
jgi:hypothetical protein